MHPRLLWYSSILGESGGIFIDSFLRVIIGFFNDISSYSNNNARSCKPIIFCGLATKHMLISPLDTGVYLMNELTFWTMKLQCLGSMSFLCVVVLSNPFYLIAGSPKTGVPIKLVSTFALVHEFDFRRSVSQTQYCHCKGWRRVTFSLL